MTQKRFKIKQSINKDGYVIIDNERQFTFPVLPTKDNYMFCKKLNELHEENQELKSELSAIKKERSEEFRIANGR